MIFKQPSNDYEKLCNKLWEKNVAENRQKSKQTVCKEATEMWREKKDTPELKALLNQAFLQPTKPKLVQPKLSFNPSCQPAAAMNSPAHNAAISEHAAIPEPTNCADIPVNTDHTNN